MSAVHLLRTLLKQRLSAADEEIFALFERTIANYEEEICRLREENKRMKKQADAHFKPEVRSHRPDMQQLLESKEGILAEQLEWNLCLEQEDSMPPTIKEKCKHPWRSQEKQYLHRMVEADITPLKSENDEEIPQLLHLHQKHSDDITEAEPPRFGCSEFDMQQLLVNKEDILSEHQEGTLSVDQEESMPRNIEEEWEQEGPQLYRLQEDNVTNFPFSVVLVKSEDDDSLHQDQTDDITEAESGGFGYFQRDIQQLLMSKEDIIAEQQEWNPSLDQDGLMSLNIKEVQKQLWTNQEGQQLHRLQEANVDKFPLSVVLVNSENDEEKLQSPQCHQSLTDDTDEITERECQRFKCSECGKTFGQKGTLNVHMRIHTGEKPYGCSECGIKFGRKGSLVVHMRIHTGEKPFGCPECGNRFREKGNLTTHMRIHTGQKPFVCSECDKRFSQKGKLDIHIRSHTGEKPFGCFVCGMRFREKGYLLKHVRVHTGHKPFGCSECSKTFTQKGDLNKHMRIHTGEKPFSCFVCGMRFREKGFLIKHVRVHTGQKPFGCSECSKAFTQKGDLNKHMRIHTGEKPFCCSECGKRFNQKGDLNKHVRIHEGVKPFCCSACGKTFVQKWHLNVHMRIHTEKQHLDHRPVYAAGPFMANCDVVHKL